MASEHSMRVLPLSASAATTSPALDAQRPQQVDQLVGVTGEFAVGPRTVGALEDRRGVGMVLGDPPEAEPAIPGAVSWLKY